MEFFCNLCLHAYVTKIEPEQLPILETFPRLIVNVEADDFEFRTLEDFELHCGHMNPKNYGWYETHFHVAAKRVFKVAGVDALKALWQTFLLPDSILIDKLQKQVHPEVANIITSWPNYKNR